MRKYYIPTSSLNFNNILSTESISPKAFYAKRGFGYSRWFTVEENNCEGVTLLYDTPHMFTRPMSDLEDHPMLIEIETDDEFSVLADGILYTEKTIYLNPWHTRFYFFSDNIKRTVLSLSDSSLETKLVRLYKRQMLVSHFDGNYTPVQDAIPVHSDRIDAYIEEDYIINKMKGLLYGYYIGANLSSSKEHIQKLDALREIRNIFSSIISSYEKIPSKAQEIRLDTLFDFLDYQQSVYLDLEKVLGSRLMVNEVLKVLSRHGYAIKTIDRDNLINGLKSYAEYNPSITWVNNELVKVKALVDSSRTLLNPDDEEIIVSPKERVISQKAIKDEQMANLFNYWTNNVLCSRSFNGKINSVKESLSDEITKAAKIVIGEDWDNSPIRNYLNQLRRHVRGEEFNKKWDNGLLSSMAAILSKGDEWEQLLHFMQSKGMSDYRLAYAIYGVLNGFANMTRDFTDLLLNLNYYYLSAVYREFFGQLHEKDLHISVILNGPTEMRNAPLPEEQTTSDKSIDQWRDDVRKYAASIIKRDKLKLLQSLEMALTQNGDNQDYFAFLLILNKLEGWKPGKNGPSAVWKKIQEHYVPDYDQRMGKSEKKKNKNKQTTTERSLFDDFKDGLQQIAQSVVNVFSDSGAPTNNTNSSGKTDDASTNGTTFDSKKGISILEDTTWIERCSLLISDSRARKQFVEDMEWFVGNHQEMYNDKKKGNTSGYYYGQDTSNSRVEDRLRVYMENKLKPRNENMKWLAEIYANIPINKIMDYIIKVYGS